MPYDTADLKSLLFVSVIYRRKVLLLLACLIVPRGGPDTCCAVELLESVRARTEPDGTRAETTFRLSPKRTSPFKSAGESVQSTAGSRGVRISVSNDGYTTFRDRVRVLATHSIRQFPLHFPYRASPCATTFRTQYTFLSVCVLV